MNSGYTTIKVVTPISASKERTKALLDRASGLIKDLKNPINNNDRTLDPYRSLYNSINNNYTVRVT